MPKKISLKPNTARLKKWVAALESGKFKKCTGQLYYDGPVQEHCALGVAMRVYEKETKTLLAERFWFGHDAMPKFVMKWFGLKSTDPEICMNKNCEDGMAKSISEINDGKRQNSFKKIAKGIRLTFGIK